jgi:hypothetical protein
MQHQTEASYFRRREREEMERAHQSPTAGGRQAHLGLAALYRRQLALLNYQPVTLVDRPMEPSR